MANVNIKFNNKDYLLSCDDGQEESLKKLTKFLDRKYSELKDKLGNIGENKLLLITTIQLIDEYFDLKQKVANQKNKLDEISNKFKEIKSLAIQYKENKDVEIKKLTKFLDKKYSELKDKLGNIGENKLLLITTIQLIDEYFDLKIKVTNQKKKLEEISNKFKEIKSLAIQYKEDKDIEIKKLHSELDSFKKTIEENNILYESMLDKTTQSLEKIISNSESLSKIQ